MLFYLWGGAGKVIVYSWMKWQVAPFFASGEGMVVVEITLSLVVECIAREGKYESNNRHRHAPHPSQQPDRRLHRGLLESGERLVVSRH